MSEDAYLEHFGVKGMKWGVRKDKTTRTAEKDAAEFARAKMFYGEGAGTRRKLIRETVASRKKKDPKYAKAFDEALERQDMGRHGQKARSERKSADRSIKRKQRTGAIARRLTGEMGTQAAFVALAGTGLAYMASGKGKAHASMAMSAAKNSKAAKAGQQYWNKKKSDPQWKDWYVKNP